MQQQLAVLDRSLANQRETLRLTEVRRDAGFGEEQDVASAAARVAAIEAACRRCGRRSRRASIGWRVLTGRVPASWPSTWRRAPYPALAKAIAARARRTSCSHGGPTCAPPNGGSRSPRPRAGRRRGGTLPAHHHLRVSSACSPAAAACSAQPTRGVGGDAGAAAGAPSTSAAPAPGCAAPRPAPRRRWPRTSRRCCWRSRRPRTRWSRIGEQQERLVSLTDQARESARAAGIARARYREGRRRLPLAARRRAHRSCRPRTMPPRRRPKSSRRWSGSIVRWVG